MTSTSVIAYYKTSAGCCFLNFTATDGTYYAIVMEISLALQWLKMKSSTGKEVHKNETPEELAS